MEAHEEPSANVEDQVIANVLRNRLIEREPEIVRMKLMGYTQEEIAQEMGVSQCAISRRLKKLQRNLA